MEYNNIPYEIIDQAVAFNFDVKLKQIETVTQIRIKINNPNVKYILLNAKQLEIVNFRLHTVQLFNKEKNKLKKSLLDKRFKSKIIYISPEEQMSINDKVFNESCLHNIHNSENFNQKFENFEDNGFITVYWWLNENDKYNRELDKIYSKGFKFYFNIEIKSRLNQPQGPVSFQIFNNKLVFIKDCTFGSSRNLFPCQDQISSKYFFSKIKITINDENFVPICSGKLIKKQKNQNQVSYFYDIQKKINPTFLGIIIGEFYQYKIKSFARSIWCLDKDKIDYFKDENTWRAIKRCETFLFSFQDDQTDIVLLPGLQSFAFTNIEEINFQQIVYPYFYYNLYLINEDFFLDDKFTEVKSYFYSYFVIYKFLSNVLEFVTFQNINAFWIIIGSCGFITDKIIHLQHGTSTSNYINFLKRQKYFEYVENGFDQQALNKPYFYNKNQIYYDKVYSLKSNLVMNMIANKLKLNYENYSTIFVFFQDNQDFLFTTQNFLEKLKQTFRIQGLKKIVYNFINFSGTIQIDLEYKYNRKSNKIDLHLQQIPLSLKYLKDNNRKRFKLEKYYNLITDANKMIQNIKREFTEKIDKFRQIFLQKIDQQHDSIVLANATRIFAKKAEVKLPYLLIESSDKDFNIEIFSLEMNNIESDSKLNLKSKFKRLNNNKKNRRQQQSEISDKKSNQSRKSSIKDSCMINAINVEGGEKFSFKIIIDPYNTLLFKINYSDTEEVLIEHLEKGIDNRTDLMNQFQLLSSMDQFPTIEIINRFCKYLQKKNVHIYVKSIILSIFLNNKDMPPMTQLSEILINQILEIKYDNDGTLKPNNFTKIEDLIFILKLLDVLLNYDQNLKILDDEEIVQDEDNIIFLILTLLQKNDNSINQKDDNYYQAMILKNLLKSKNTRFFPQICDELLRYIKIEYYNMPQSKYIISVIFEYFGQFVINNMRIQNYNLNPQKENKFSLLEIFTENSSLKEILDFFQKLKKYYKSNSAMGVYIFRHKLFIKEIVKGYKLPDILIYSLKFIKKMKNKFGNIVGNSLLNQFTKYLEERKEKLYELQMELYLKNIDTIYQLIWEQMTCQYSIVDSCFKYNYMQIYRLIFDEFSPISLYEKEKNVLFPIDKYWIEINKRLELNRFYNKTKKNVILQYLSLQKKTKKGQIISPPKNFKYNIRDIIFQHFKVNKETLNNRNMAKHIVNILLTEKITMEIENKYFKDKRDLDERVDDLNYSIKDIKKKLMKTDINSLEDLRYEIYQVVDFFRIKNWINDEIYKEYINFVNLLISEAETILQEKLDSQRKKNDKLKIKIDLKSFNQNNQLKMI